MLAEKLKDCLKFWVTSNKSDKKNDKKRRPLWIMRVIATSVDVGFAFELGKLMHLDSLKTYVVYIIWLFFYYILFEFYFKRTPAKFLFGMKIVTKDGSIPTKKRFFLRSLLRFFVFLILGWNRVSLLDLLSGCRVEKIVIKHKIKEPTKVEGWR
jgi:hypothetical protein